MSIPNKKQLDFLITQHNKPLEHLEKELKKLELMEAVRVRKPYNFNPRFIALLDNQEYKIEILKFLIEAKKNT